MSMNKILSLLFAVFSIAALTLTSCSDENDEPGKINLGVGQSDKVTLGANETTGQILFNAAASWSAWLESGSRAPEELGWIRLEDTHGEAGEVYLNFSLDLNLSGQTRSAIVVIVCEDTTIRIEIIQTPDDDPDIPDQAANGSIEIVKKDHIYNYDGTIILEYEENFILNYDGNRLVNMLHSWRDDIDNGPGMQGDSYVMNEEKWQLNWQATEVMVHVVNDMTYYPSQRKEVETSEHFALLNENLLVKSGWYKWAEDYLQTDFDISYDNLGIVSSRNNDGDGQNVWDTFTWTDGNLTKITCTNGHVITMTYAKPDLTNLRKAFDLNWLLPTELECYDFAAGDITRIWGVTGFLGHGSELLMTEITESDGKNVQSYRMNYTKNTKEETVVTVDYFVDNRKSESAEWTIRYRNHIP